MSNQIIFFRQGQRFERTIIIKKLIYFSGSLKDNILIFFRQPETSNKERKNETRIIVCIVVCGCGCGSICTARTGDE
ncbi:MAG: hypothetical protein IJ881_07990 [Neisseriaceae bacterium]|nr:hypothetical protein [Neisseriaceae bacterium]